MNTTAEDQEKLEIARKRAKWIADARQMLDFLETKPDLIDDLGGIHLGFYVYGDGPQKEDREKNARKKTARFARMMGKSEKEWNDYALEIKKKFGSHQLRVSVAREAICERKVIGTEHVPEYRVSAHTKEIVEWVCEDPSILRAVK